MTFHRGHDELPEDQWFWQLRLWGPEVLLFCLPHNQVPGERGYSWGFSFGYDLLRDANGLRLYWDRWEWAVHWKVWFW